jgi:uncharacterized membrane protein YhaH (DUF805 family)
MIWTICVILLIIALTVVLSKRKEEDMSAIIMVLNTVLAVMVYHGRLPAWILIVPIAIIVFYLLGGGQNE